MDRANTDEPSRFNALVQVLSEQWPSLCYVGYGFWMGWIFLSFRSFELMRGFTGAELTNVYQHSSLATLSAAITLLIVSLAWKYFDAVFKRKLPALVAGLVASVAILVLYYGSPGNGLLFTISSIFIGIGTSIVCLKVGVLYSSLGLKTSIVNAAMSILVAVFLYFCGIGIPETWRPFFIAALPLLGGIVMMLERPAKQDEFSGSKKDASEARNMPLGRLLVAVAIISLISGIVSGTLVKTVALDVFLESQSMVVFLVGVCAIAMAVFITVGKGVDRIALVYLVLMTIEAVILLFGPYIPETIVFADIEKECLRVIFLCLFAYFSFKFGVSPVKIYGGGQAVYLFAHNIGWLIGFHVFPHTAIAYSFLGVAGAIALVVTMTFILTQSTIKALSIEQTPDYGRILDQAQAFDSKNPEKFFVEHGLSKREIEIVLLFLKGYSARWIGDELNISESTVRSHFHTIYSKLNIHSQQELKRLLQ